MKFEAPREPQFLQLKDGEERVIEIMERIGDHAEFKCGKEPASVYLVKQPTRKDELAKLTVTSTQLSKTLALVEKEFGSIFGVRMTLKAEGEEKERKYAIVIRDDVADELRAKRQVTLPEA